MNGFGFTSQRGPVQTMSAAHSHADLEINFLTEGSLTYLIGGRIRRVPARMATIFWGAVPHHLLRAEGTGDLFWFTVPFAWVLAWDLPAENLRRLLTGEIWTDAAGDTITEADCQRWQQDLSGKTPERLRACELEIHARLLRLVISDSRTKTTPAATGPVERMAAFIAAHFTDAIGIADITETSGLQTSYAMTVFRRTCGLTLHDYLVQHRIFFARRLLVTTSRTVLDIALASGFGSLSSFHEAFRRTCGCSPGAFRNQHSDTAEPQAGKKTRRVNSKR
jgi:AraC-like DNA-binding protein